MQGQQLVQASRRLSVATGCSKHAGASQQGCPLNNKAAATFAATKRQRQWQNQCQHQNTHPRASAPAMASPRAADLPRPRAAVSATVLRSVFSAGWEAGSKVAEHGEEGQAWKLRGLLGARSGAPVEKGPNRCLLMLRRCAAARASQSGGRGQHNLLGPVPHASSSPDAASRKVTTALAWSSVRHLPTSAPAGCTQRGGEGWRSARALVLWGRRPGGQAPQIKAVKNRDSQPVACARCRPIH